MTGSLDWWRDLERGGRRWASVSGLVPVKGYKRLDLSPDQIVVMERAQKYGADAVFFSGTDDTAGFLPQAFIYRSSDTTDEEFAQLHRQLWSWGGVPLVYRLRPGRVDLLRCAHRPDFAHEGEIVYRPNDVLRLAVQLELELDQQPSAPWWDVDRLANGTLWDDPAVCSRLMSSRQAAAGALIAAVGDLKVRLDVEKALPVHLRRKLLILSLLIAYLEERQVFPKDYWSKILPGARRFLDVLANGEALVTLLTDLEARFNGDVFSMSLTDQEVLRKHRNLGHFSRLIEAREVNGGQLSLWQLYSFRDLPIELISHVYQLFVKNSESSIYTPPFVARMMLRETLTWDRIQQLIERKEVIFDPSCGSGVFLVEAYKRLVLHWRSTHGWRRPSVAVLKQLLKMVHGVDLELGAIELAGFSLCLAMCDALEPEEMRSTIPLFPGIVGETLFVSCFFDWAKARADNADTPAIGCLVGNPPFEAKLATSGAQAYYQLYRRECGTMPDNQVAYLFLHRSMDILAAGGVLAMLQQANFLYSSASRVFRKSFISRHDVREIYDFVSIRGLFSKGDADTKALVVVAEKNTPPVNRKVLHATFRRSGRVEAQQGFDIDYYDLHFVPRAVAIEEDRVWRANLFGGGRALALSQRLAQFPTLGAFAKKKKWIFGEGFIKAKSPPRHPAVHLTGKLEVPAAALGETGIDLNQIRRVEETLFRTSHGPERFRGPMVLVRAHEELGHGFWKEGTLTYQSKVIGFCGPEKDTKALKALDEWFGRSRTVLRAYLGLTSPGLYSSRATTCQQAEILSLPYSEDGTFGMSPNDDLCAEDIVKYMGDFIRLGQKSEVMQTSKPADMDSFRATFTRQINAVFRKHPLRALPAFAWPGVICQPFVFGEGLADWTGTDDLKGKIESLLLQRQSRELRMTRIVRLYDDPFVIIVKPAALRYWLPSIALRDADEMLVDLATAKVG